MHGRESIMEERSRISQTQKDELIGVFNADDNQSGRWVVTRSSFLGEFAKAMRIGAVCRGSERSR